MRISTSAMAPNRGKPFVNVAQGRGTADCCLSNSSSKMTMVDRGLRLERPRLGKAIHTDDPGFSTHVGLHAMRLVASRARLYCRGMAVEIGHRGVYQGLGTGARGATLLASVALTLKNEHLSPACLRLLHTSWTL